MTYKPNDHVKVKRLGEIVTMTITKQLPATNAYAAVTSRGQRIVILPDEIVGLA